MPTNRVYRNPLAVLLGTGRPANMHLVISDASGDSAVFEYVDCKLVIHHGKQYRVVTNSPPTTSNWRSWSTGRTPATFWVKLDDLDLRPGAPVKKLQLAGGKTYSGNAVSQFVDARLFTFQDLTDVAPAK